MLRTTSKLKFCHKVNYSDLIYLNYFKINNNFMVHKEKFHSLRQLHFSIEVFNAICN